MSAAPELTACDREPIHTPGSIQPHGLLLVVDRDGLAIRYVAGDVEGRLGAWSGMSLDGLIGADVSRRACAVAEAHAAASFVAQIATPAGETFDIQAHRSGTFIVIELEPAGVSVSSAVLLAGLGDAAALFERAGSLKVLCEAGAAEFRRLTGYDRVMVYRFLDDGAGAVLAEDKRPDLHSFLNHHFPATDIPRQARALYARNPVRVIPDATYEPAPLRPEWREAGPLDLSGSILRSVSPVHLHYLANLGVAASASISIVKDEVLWGLIACHNSEPRVIPYDIRAACQVLAAGFARLLKAREDSETLRSRLRLLGFEDEITALLSRDGSLEEALSNHIEDVRMMLDGDGVAVLRGTHLVTGGACPPESDVRSLANWALNTSVDTIFASDRLVDAYPPSAEFQAVASGMLAMTLSVGEPWIVLWFRAEQIEVINWAGNPHKDVDPTSDDVLTPRASFAAWRETVRGRSRRWTLPEREAATRLKGALIEIRRHRQLQELNRRLVESSHEKDLLIQQKQFLIGEVNHRVQNSLQLVSSFLSLQARESDMPELRAALDEARERLSAVALVHRRLYHGDQIEVIDAARYIEELCVEMKRSMGPGWSDQISLDLAPLMIPADRAITVGLVLTELIINAQKYAYGGSAGPLDIRLHEDRARFLLVVADQGGGKTKTTSGFGSRMVEALVAQLHGELVQADNAPGLRVTLSAPIVAERPA